MRWPNENAIFKASDGLICAKIQRLSVDKTNLWSTPALDGPWPQPSMEPEHIFRWVHASLYMYEIMLVGWSVGRLVGWLVG